MQDVNYLISISQEETSEQNWWGLQKFLCFISINMDKHNEITLQASRTSLSVSNDITSTPTIGEHDLKVITLRISGWSSPCKVTKLAI